MLGLRNAWTFSFAPGSRALFIADVGWSNFEEINFLPADDAGGGNFGWRIFEGDAPVEQGGAREESAEEFRFPVYSYPHLSHSGMTAVIPSAAQ